MPEPCLSHRQIAEIMTARGYPMGKSRVYEIERRALAKLRRELKHLADETTALASDPRRVPDPIGLVAPDRARRFRYETAMDR